jgi:hypothetical protein
MRKIKTRSSITTRLKYAWSWFRHPAALLLILIGCVAFCLTVDLAFPCNKSLYPIHGVCSNGSQFKAPSDSIQTGIIIFVVLALLLIVFTGPAPTKWSNREFIETFRDSLINDPPKWYLRWFWRVLPAMIIGAIWLVYYVGRDSGLHWYNYLVQYIVLAPAMGCLVTIYALELAEWTIKKGFKR